MTTIDFISVNSTSHTDPGVNCILISSKFILRKVEQTSTRDPYKNHWSVCVYVLVYISMYKCPSMGQVRRFVVFVFSFGFFSMYKFVVLVPCE